MYSYDKAVNILSQIVSCTLRALFGHLPQAELGEGGHWTNLGVDALMDVVLLHKVWKTKYMKHIFCRIFIDFLLGCLLFLCL